VARHQRSTPLKLVVIDDDLNTRRGLGSLLRALGHHVRTFGSAEEWLAGAVDGDCAIVDIALPGLSGLDLHAKLRSEGRSIPTVFVTAQDDVVLLAAIQQTSQPLVRKPLDEDALVQAIERATRVRP
jgi:FixJ family two-component response regulator